VLHPDGHLLECWTLNSEDGIKVFDVGGQEQHHCQLHDACLRNYHHKENVEPSYLREWMRLLYTTFSLSIHFRLPFHFFLHSLAVLGHAQ